MEISYEVEELDTILRNDFASFVAIVFHTLLPSARYDDNFHIDAICHQLNLVRDGSTTRLIITLPPRSLKSICVSIAFAAFMHGHDPTLNIVCASYAQSLSVKMQNDYRTVLTTSWYRRIFPRTVISTLKNSEHEVLLTARGGRLATSTGGPLTGRGADLLIIDDPLSAVDSDSDAARNAVNDWFGPVALSRLNDKKTGAVIVVAQRLHEDDLVGYLLRNDPEGWVHLNLPAIADVRTLIPTGAHTSFERTVGSVLNPERDTLEELNTFRRTLGERKFEALYQQRPTPPGGTLFKRKWFRYFDELPAREDDDRVYQSWDTASKTESHHDYSVCTTWQIKGGMYHLLDVWRGRPEFTELKRIAHDLAVRYKVRGVLVEDAGIGTSLVSELVSMRVSAIGIKATQNKKTRAESATPIFESGRVRFLRNASWRDLLEAELLAFPGGRHDDQVDSITQMLRYEMPSGLTMRWIKF